MSGMTILCVEDRSEYMATLTCMLEGIGYEVLPARNRGRRSMCLPIGQLTGSCWNITCRMQPHDVARAIESNAARRSGSLFDGVSNQTAIMLRFFDAYLRNMERVGDELEDLEHEPGSDTSDKRF